MSQIDVLDYLKALLIFNCLLFACLFLVLILNCYSGIFELFLYGLGTLFSKNEENVRKFKKPIDKNSNLALQYTENYEILNFHNYVVEIYR